jgi:hypothetical protein
MSRITFEDPLDRINQRGYLSVTDICFRKSAWISNLTLRCLQVYFVSLLISYPQWNTKMSVDIYADISIDNLQDIQYCPTKLKKTSILNLQMDIHFDKLGEA